ncbi:hypothetical protein TrRE_jg9357, partial [Triparma retinervis]
PEVYEQYRKLEKELLEKKLTEDIRKEERRRLEEEQARRAAMDAQQRKVYDARMRIVDDILTLRLKQGSCRNVQGTSKISDWTTSPRDTEGDYLVCKEKQQEKFLKKI